MGSGASEFPQQLRPLVVMVLVLVLVDSQSRLPSLLSVHIDEVRFRGLT